MVELNKNIQEMAKKDGVVSKSEWIKLNEEKDLLVAAADKSKKESDSLGECSFKKKNNENVIFGQKCDFWSENIIFS